MYPQIDNLSIRAAWYAALDLDHGQTCSVLGGKR